MNESQPVQGSLSQPTPLFPENVVVKMRVVPETYVFPCPNCGKDTIKVEKDDEPGTVKQCFECHHSTYLPSGQPKRFYKTKVFWISVVSSLVATIILDALLGVSTWFKEGITNSPH